MKCRYRVLVLIGAGLCVLIMLAVTGEEVTSWFIQTSSSADLKGPPLPITSKLKLVSSPSIIVAPTFPPHNNKVVYGESKGSLMSEKGNVIRDEEDDGPRVTTPPAAVQLKRSAITRHR